MANVTILDSDQFDHELPDICMYCGQTAVVRRKHTFTYHPEWLIVLFLLGGLPLLIGLLFLAKRMEVEVPLCDRHRNHWSKRRKILWFGMAGVVLVPILVALIAAALPRHSEYFIGPIMLPWLLGFLTWLVILIVLRFRVMYAVDMDEDSVTVSRVSPVFARAYRKLLSRGGFGSGGDFRSRIDLDETVRKQWNEKPGKINPPRQSRRDREPDEDIVEGIILPDEP